MSVSLTSLLIPSKEVEIEYPGLEGLTIKVAFLAREELVKIRKKATKTTYKNRASNDEVNDELFLKLYVNATIRGWSGFKYKYLQELSLVDLSSIKDLEEELAYNEDNALALMKSSTEFDSFISDTVSDLQNFTKTS